MAKKPFTYTNIYVCIMFYFKIKSCQWSPFILLLLRVKTFGLVPCIHFKHVMTTMLFNYTWLTWELLEEVWSLKKMQILNHLCRTDFQGSCGFLFFRQFSTYWLWEIHSNDLAELILINFRFQLTVTITLENSPLFLFMVEEQMQHTILSTIYCDFTVCGWFTFCYWVAKIIGKEMNPIYFFQL